MNSRLFIPPFVTSKNCLLVAVFMLSALLVAYGPMAMYSYAQSSVAGELQSLKEKATKELDRRIANYQKSMDDLSIDFSVSKDGASVSTGSDASKAVGATFTYGEGGITGTVQLPKETQDKVKSFLQKMIDQLKGMKSKVTKATSLASIKSMAENIEAQYDLDKLTNVQATVTQSIESMTGVLDKLKTTFNNLQGQVIALKDCAKDGTSLAECLNDNTLGSDISTSNAADQAQSQLDSLGSIISTMSSIIASSVTLLLTLVTQFTNIVGELGNSGSIENLGNMLNEKQLGELTNSRGGVGGLLGSFTAITSQLDIANLISGNAANGLTDINNQLNP